MPFWKFGQDTKIPDEIKSVKSVLLMQADGTPLSEMKVQNVSDVMNEVCLTRMLTGTPMPEVRRGDVLRLQSKQSELMLQVKVKDVTRFYIVATYVKTIKDKERRMYIRYAVNRTACLTNADRPELGDIKQECQLVDLSLGGAKILSNYDYAKNRNMVLHVTLFDGGETVGIPCRVVRSKAAQGKQTEYGLSFDVMPPPVIKYLGKNLKILATA